MSHSLRTHCLVLIFLAWFLHTTSFFSMLMKPPSLYYLALVLNALGRISWIATLESSWCYAGCALLFAFIEIGRRFMWLAFRLEHQVLKFAETHHATTNKYIVPHLAG